MIFLFCCDKEKEVSNYKYVILHKYIKNNRFIETNLLNQNFIIMLIFQDYYNDSKIKKLLNI